MHRDRKSVSDGYTSAADGFTLIELLVVIAIISVTLAVVGPRLAQRMEGAALHSATADLQTLAKAGRGYAVVTGRTVVLLLSAEGRKIGLVANKTSAADTQQTALIPVRGLPEGVSVRLRSTSRDTAREQRIHFRPDGSTDAGELILRDGKGGEMRMEMLGPVGRFRVVQQP